MSANTRHDSVSAALFGRVRRAVLALLFSRPEESFYLRQIERILGSSHGAVYRELGNLVRAGLVLRTSHGKQVNYQANSGSPVFNELRGLIVKTAGVADVLRSALTPLADRVGIAFVYGSFARGEEQANSDVDVMLIGDLDFGEAVSSLGQAEAQLSREVNPSVFTAAEVKQRIRDKEHFLTSVMHEPKIMLIGDDNELEQLSGGESA